MQKSASTQPRTSLSKFGGDITRAGPRRAARGTGTLFGVFLNRHMPQWFLVSGLTVLLAFLFGKAFVSAQKQYAKEQQLLEEEAAAGMSGIERPVSGRAELLATRANFRGLVLGCIEAKFCK